MTQLAQQAKVEFNDVPFKGPAEEIQNTRSGQLDFSAVPLTAAAGSGLTMPGLFAATRNPSLPDVPNLSGARLRRRAAEFWRPVRPGRDAGGGHEKLEAACIAIMKSDAAQRVVKKRSSRRIISPTARALRRT